jgi:Domain of unknown function (DUF4190)/GYF domain 2
VRRMYKMLGADGKEYGPISHEQLKQWMAEGRANAQTKLLPEGSTEWKPLGTLPEFQTSFPPPPIGQPIPPSTTPPTIGAPQIIAAPQTGKTNTLGVVGLICGILSFFCCCWGFPLSIVGILCSILALNQIKSRPDLYNGKGMAIAGLILSISSLLLIGIYMLFTFGISGHPDILREMRRL